MKIGVKYYKAELQCGHTVIRAVQTGKKNAKKTNQCMCDVCKKRADVRKLLGRCKRNGERVTF